jgi:class 3 adenylate cyclase
VLFADIVDFTALCEQTAAADVVRLLDRVFTTFDRLAEKHSLEKIKTIGDAYMVAAGVPEPRADHLEAVASMALDMRDAMRELAIPPFESLGVRIGIHTGPVIAGVIGERKFAYDLWGDTVNIASRMESHGQRGRIHVSAAVHHRLKDRFRFEPRGKITIKGKAEMDTFFLVG